MDSTTKQHLGPALDRIRTLLADMIWLESMMPVYHFQIDDADFGWSPHSGLTLGRPASPTCVVHIPSQTLRELLAGNQDPRSLQRQDKLQLGGLLSDAVALSKIFLPEDQKIARWKSLLSEPEFSLRMWSTDGRRLQVERILPALDRLEQAHGESLARVRNALAAWIDHRISTCRLNQWVRFDFEGLAVEPWEDPAAMDAIVAPAFPALRAESIALLDGRVRAPHYGGSESDPDTPAPNQPFGWRSYNIIEHFEWKHERAALFPETSAVLGALAQTNTIAHAGFLIMDPGLVLPPHCDGANWMLSYQFGLIVPDGCYLEVDGERRYHREGQGLVFNDSFVHSAGNESAGPRVLLAILHANPALSSAERLAMMEVANRLQTGAMVYAK
ncbi:aspartyl/asparaginyl beta-hydroxylase domain-containing protein [uncultured Sphingomonas sp.]|uniref:aspartyl/asparaginyl beta-hydroxylase domain-containing protein n=1 Tax=uncultured Sphingomonas sp. TaxID=158754 RepID=UPI0025DF0980|nr:aspartyl/asparaginyl beta-hydroxylase domain-containing protein [uncultured Sphingomonas sp.]